MAESTVRAVLEEERKKTQGRLDALDGEFNEIVAASQDANGDDEHDPEGATVAFERERTAALRARAQAYLGELDQALARLVDGNYGTCRTCGCPIGAERLNALPVTEVCTACAGIRRAPLGLQKAETVERPHPHERASDKVLRRQRPPVPRIV